ncbi:MAG: preprotein translocase subunit YajC [Oscillibacter sp.]|nr:preprotein translocase subunit YajC [Oscillibacter sp.]
MDYSILMIVVMLAVMYFIMIRPENKRKKKAQEMRDSLKKGDIITSIGGIIGRIVSVSKDTIVIETSDDRVRVELAKWAVSSVGVQSGEEPVEQKEEKKEKKKLPASSETEEK